MNLADIIGQPGVDEIQKLGAIRFHCVGDTGANFGTSTAQGQVADAMSLDYQPAGAGANPAFFLHLGDVIYGIRKDAMYLDEFYRPYKGYPGKIIAIAGNHDGETIPVTDPTPLEAFLNNFCAPTALVPPIASGVGIYRQTMTEPGVYWTLDAPFVQIIGLYSNVGDGPGYLTGAGGDKTQTTWLLKTLKELRAARDAGTRKALIVAVHHPPYSLGDHSGSPAVLAALDTACQSAGIMPDAILSGHSHNYQRHTRHIKFQNKSMDIPFIVAGCGGHDDQAVVVATGQVDGDHTFDKSRQGYGYLMVTVTPQQLTLALWAVPSPTKAPFDTVSVNLATNRLV